MLLSRHSPAEQFGTEGAWTRTAGLGPQAGLQRVHRAYAQALSDSLDQRPSLSQLAGCLMYLSSLFLVSEP
jgi:hypothetical protein